MGSRPQINDEAEAIDRFDHADAVLVDIAHDADLAIEPPAGGFVFAVLMRGDATLCHAGKALLMGAGTGAVISRADHRLNCRSGAKVMLINLPRQRFQAQMSRIFGGARLLSRKTLLVQGDGDLQALLARVQARRSMAAPLQSSLFDALGRHLVNAHGLDHALPGSRSIGLARALLDEGVGAGWDAKALAGRAGITAVTLQRGFRECLGVTVAAYAQGLRLDAARERLLCGRESRSMMQIARHSGFQTAIAFTRAYQKRFAETPTQTRIHAVRFNNGPHEMA